MCCGYNHVCVKCPHEWNWKEAGSPASLTAWGLSGAWTMGECSQYHDGPCHLKIGRNPVGAPRPHLGRSLGFLLQACWSSEQLLSVGHRSEGVPQPLLLARAVFPVPRELTCQGQKALNSSAYACRAWLKQKAKCMSLSSGGREHSQLCT
jgi:hypothetical protein